MNPLDKTAAIQVARRNLPHWAQPGCMYFVTFRLADSLPQSLLRPWREERARWLENHPRPWSAEVAREYWREFQAKKEKWLDAGHGSCALRDPGQRGIVAEAFRHFDGERYELDAFVIMPNHVHLLVMPMKSETGPGTAGATPPGGREQSEKGKSHETVDVGTAGTAVSLSSILHSWKSFTGHRLVKEFGHAVPFWMDENFDHVLRSEEQRLHFRNYIRENPSKARLAAGAYTCWEREAEGK